MAITASVGESGVFIGLQIPARSPDEETEEPVYLLLIITSVQDNSYRGALLMGMKCCLTHISQSWDTKRNRFSLNESSSRSAEGPPTCFLLSKEQKRQKKTFRLIRRVCVLLHILIIVPRKSRMVTPLDLM